MLLYSIVAKHRAGFGIPLAFFLTKDESQDSVENWLRFLKNIGMQPKFIMIDISEVIIHFRFKTFQFYLIKLLFYEDNVL